MPALTIQGDPTRALDAIAEVVAKYPRVRIVEQRADYLHATFTSLVFRFVDDVEFYVDSEARLLHYRSASRVGHSDFGVNRKRMQKLIQHFEREGIAS